jgi:hypothetical protein
MILTSGIDVVRKRTITVMVTNCNRNSSQLASVMAVLDIHYQPSAYKSSIVISYYYVGLFVPTLT